MFKFLWSWALYTWGGLHRHFGHANVMPSEHRRAIHYFERAYQVDPTFVGAKLHRGVLLSREFGQHEEALLLFDEILGAQPDHREALLNRGLTLQENGRYRDALIDLDAYLALPERDKYWDETNRLVASLREIVDELEDSQ